jgi:hypothetical protein
MGISVPIDSRQELSKIEGKEVYEYVLDLALHKEDVKSE